MGKRNAFVVLLLMVSMFSVMPSYAQRVPGVSGPTCVPVPGMPCPGSSASSGSSRGSSSISSAMRDQLSSEVADIFVRWFLNNDAKAAAQKQQMMEELEHRKAEAQRQHNFEEAQRLEAICNRLSATLKLSGLPGLQLKGAGASAGGLQLKLGGDGDGHVGIKGLPGIALNDNTGNGGSTPYGIPGLPGIYTNGPGSGSGSTSPSGSTLQLKTGDESTPPAPVAVGSVSATAAGPAHVDAVPADLAAALRDPQSMTPQQLADAATLVNSLPPEEQQRLMDAARASAQTAGGGAPSQPAGQLQQIAKASQSAASAQSLEDAAAQARTGFDQGANGALISVTPQTTTPQTTPSGSAPPSSPAATGTTNGTVAPPARGDSRSPMMGNSVDLRQPDPGKPAVVQPLSTGTPGRAPGCPIDSTKRLPTREELAQELSGLRSRLDVLKNSLLRLNRSIQMDQGQFAEWEKETQDAVNRSDERLKKAIADKIEERFFGYAEGYYDKSPEKLKALKRVELLLHEGDVYDWADKGEKTWDQVAEGLDLLGGNLPLSESAKDVLWASKNTIDSAFDIATELVSWRRISQLQKNSDAYLAAVKQSGEQMKQTVGRIREIEDHLASGTYATETRSHQAGTAVCE